MKTKSLQLYNTVYEIFIEINGYEEAYKKYTEPNEEGILSE